MVPAKGSGTVPVVYPKCSPKPQFISSKIPRKEQAIFTINGEIGFCIKIVEIQRIVTNAAISTQSQKNICIGSSST